MINLHFSIERWKWNPKLELYVSTHGRFRNSCKHLVDIKIGKGGYCYVYAGGEHHNFVLAHRAVLSTWRPCARMKELTIDHLDHNKRNNSLANLDWVTVCENGRRAKADCVDIETKSENVTEAEGAKNTIGFIAEPVVKSKYDYRIKLIDNVILTVEQLTQLVSKTHTKFTRKEIEKNIVESIKNGRKKSFGYMLEVVKE